MAYNLYQVQMARAWAERIDKENAMAEKFWTQQALKNSSMLPGGQMTAGRLEYDQGSVAPSSVAPSGFTSKTSFLKYRLEKLEGELAQEREYRKKVEEDLTAIKAATMPGSKPQTPRH